MESLENKNGRCVQLPRAKLLRANISKLLAASEIYGVIVYFGFFHRSSI